MQTTSPRPLRAVGAALLVLVPFMQLATPPASTAHPSERHLQRAEQRLDAALADFRSVTARLERAKAELAAIQARTERLEGEVERTAQRVVEAEETVIENARAIYMSGSGGMLEGLLGSRSIADLETGLTYLQSSGRTHSAELERLIVNRKLLETRLDELDAKRERAAEIAADMSRLAASIGNEVTRRRAQVAAVREIQAQARAVTQSPPGPKSRTALTGTRSRSANRAATGNSPAGITGVCSSTPTRGSPTEEASTRATRTKHLACNR